MKKKLFNVAIFFYIFSFTFVQAQESKYCKVRHQNYKENYISLIKIIPNVSSYPVMESTWKEDKDFENVGGYDDLSQVLSGEMALGDSISFYTEHHVKDLKTPFWYYLFMDWNSDGDFMDFGETLMTIQPNDSDNMRNIFKFKVPDSINFLGYKVFRLRMSSVNLDAFNNLPACAGSGEGETEDHLVLVKSPAITAIAIGSTNSPYVYQVGPVLELKNMDNNRMVQVCLRSIDGKILKSQYVGKDFLIDIGNIETGMYFIDIIDLSGIVITKKVIVNRQ